MKIRRLTSLCLLLLVAACALRSADVRIDAPREEDVRRLQIRIDKPFQAAPGRIKVTALVAPHPDNFAIRIGVDGPKSRNSVIKFEDEPIARRQFIYEVRDLPDGPYWAYVELQDRQKVIAVERVQFQVGGSQIDIFD